MLRLIMTLLVIGGCATGPDTGRSATEQPVSSNPLHWMVGDWFCGTGSGYFNVPPFVGHSTVGTYTITEDAHGIVHGAYHELSADGRPLVDFDDTWHIGSIPDSNGNVAADYSQMTSDGFSASATGTVHGPVPNVLGSSQFEGSLTFPDSSVHAWHANAIGTTNTGTKMTVNYSFGSLSFKRLYFDLACTPTIGGGPLGMRPIGSHGD